MTRIWMSSSSISPERGLGRSPIVIGALVAACAAAPAPPASTLLAPAVAPSASAVAPAASGPLPGDVTSKPLRPSPFHPVSTVTDPGGNETQLAVQLLRIGSQPMLVGHKDAGYRLFRVGDDGVSRDEVVMPRGREGVGRWFQGMFGRWPDRVYLVGASFDGGGRYHNTWWLYRREASTWKPILQHDDPNSMVASMESGRAGPRWDGVVAVMPDGRVLGRFNDTLRVLDGPKGVVPKLASAAACGGHARVAFPDWNERGTMLALPSGHLVVAGKDCAGDGLAMEWFAPGQAAGNVVTFGKGCVLAGIAGPRVDALTIWTKCDGQAARDVLQGFDGSRLVEVAYPGRLITDLAVTPSGTLYTEDIPAGVLEVRAPNGAWSEIPLGDAAGDLAVVGEDDIWLFDFPTLYRNRPSPDPVPAFAWPADDAQVATSFRAPRAATRGCESIFVLFYEFAKTTPAGYDFPLTRKALRGHAEFGDGTRLVVTRDHGKTYFGAFAFDLAEAKRLADLVKKGVPDARPEVLCAKPDVVREIKIDWATGEVAK